MKTKIQTINYENIGQNFAEQYLAGLTELRKAGFKVPDYKVRKAEPEQGYREDDLPDEDPDDPYWVGPMRMFAAIR